MTLLVVGYKTKAELKATVGKPLRYRETAVVGAEYDANGRFTVAHRPQVTGFGGREFFAKVTMENGKIARVE